ncbi:MAG TPA: SPOR domain-containing protein, partial [Gemmatimonadaceae bacterium]|nr:SPOR domain-containing protein [Gemmatimonadaceae bacterium]
VTGAAKDFWYFFAWDGFRPRARGLDQPVTFGDSGSSDSLAASSTPSATPETPAPGATDTTAASPVTSAPTSGFTVQFAAILTEEKAQQIAASIRVGATPAHVASSTIGGSPIYRVVMGPFTTKEEAERVGRAAKHEYWVYEGSP